MIDDNTEAAIAYAMSLATIGALGYVIYYLLEAASYPIVV